MPTVDLLEVRSVAEDLLVEMTGITKDFPGVHALADASFELRRGEVHALVGENGAGKSTLMKILAGIYRPDAGVVRVAGREVAVTTPHEAQDLGISIVHQELNLMPHLTVAQNIFIGREPRGRIPFVVDDAALNRQASGLFERLRLKLDPRIKVSDLAVAQQQMVEIAKALSFDSQVLIMDEPTAALTDSEVEELKKISDRVTVMRDGRYIATMPTAEAPIGTIINLMVGRTMYEEARAAPEAQNEEIVLEVRGLNRGRMVRDINLTLRRGEILGVAGLMGAGRTEVARAIFGADAKESGEVFVHGRKVEIRSPSDAVNLGIGYLSEDRKRFGLAIGMDVETNIVLASLRKWLSALGRIDTGRTRTIAEAMVKSLSIKTPSIKQKVRNLSGGNQQKVIIGKWLTADTDIMIFDEPTRGIDVGSKSEIYHLLNELARQGKSVIMISSELPEILRMSHRIVVMCEGRITGELNGSDATQEQVMVLATQREALAA